MHPTQPKELQYRISLPHDQSQTIAIGKAEISWNKCLVFTDGTKKFIKYFKSKTDDKGNRIALRQTYTTYMFGDELRAFRTVVKTNLRTKEVLKFVRGSEECRKMIADFNMLGVKIKELVAESVPVIKLKVEPTNVRSNKQYKKIIHLGV